MNQDIKDLLAYYNRQPDPIMINRTFGLISGLQEEKQKEVITWLLDHVPKKAGLDIPTLKNAMAEVGASTPQSLEQPRPWICDLCGTTFRRVTISHDALRRQGVHDYCPRCGLSPNDTDCANKYTEMAGGKRTVWYTRLLQDITNARLQPGARPRYDPKSDNAHDEEMHRQKIDRMKSEAQQEARETMSTLAQSKRVAV